MDYNVPPGIVMRPGPTAFENTITGGDNVPPGANNNNNNPPQPRPRDDYWSRPYSVDVAVAATATQYRDGGFATMSPAFKLPAGLPPPSSSLATSTPSPSAPAAPDATVNKLTEDQARAVVLIKGDKAEGTGFLVKTPTGPVVITNIHVISNNPKHQDHHQHGRAHHGALAEVCLRSRSRHARGQGRWLQLSPNGGGHQQGRSARRPGGDARQQRGR